jgi:hypothetical protein
LLADLVPGNGSSWPQSFVGVGPTLYFVATDLQAGRELWVLRAGLAAPSEIVLSGGTIAEGLPAGTLVGCLRSVDPDYGDTFHYSFATGPGDTDNACFVLTPDGRLSTAMSFDHATQAVYSIRVRTADQTGRWFEKSFSLSVLDAQPPPVNVALTCHTVAVGSPAGTVVGLLTGDDIHSPLSYTLVPGPGSDDWPAFTIDSNQLKTTAAFNSLAKDCYQVRVRATNAAGLYTENSFTIDVQDQTTLDVDGNGTADALTDGILILRYLFAPAGSWTYSDAVGVGAMRTNRETIKAFLDGGQTTMLDVDGNGTADALTDGILMLRYLFAPAGSWTYSDAVGVGATRTNREQIRAFLDQFHRSLAEEPDTTAEIADTLAGLLTAERLDRVAARLATIGC